MVARALSKKALWCSFKYFLQRESLSFWLRGVKKLLQGSQNPNILARVRGRFERLG